jgi:acyl carrier protein
MSVDRQQAMQQVCEVLAGVCAVPAASINEASARGALPNWDSMGHLNVIMELESRLGVSFSTDEVLAMGTVREIVDVIVAKR